MVAAALLSVMGFSWLFGGTALGFLASAALVLSVALPSPQPPDAAEGAWGRITRGARICLATPRLRGLLALNLAVAAAGAMVIVNTVVVVRGGLGLDDRALALTLAAYGAGSMAAALSLPGLFDRGLGERATMLAGAALLALGMAAGPFCAGGWGAVLALWACLGVGNGLVLTPTGRLLRRSAHAGDRPALFAAQFALSHASWLLTYPLAGVLGASAGMPATFAAMAALAAGAVAAAAALWPRDDAAEIEHDHAGLAHDHPHLAEHAAIPVAAGRFRHRHAYVIDAEHPRWPRSGRHDR
jgi:predicted MFS family arabinose efflux permease